MLRIIFLLIALAIAGGARTAHARAFSFDSSVRPDSGADATLYKLFSSGASRDVSIQQPGAQAVVRGPVTGPQGGSAGAFGFPPLNPGAAGFKYRVFTLTGLGEGGHARFFNRFNRSQLEALEAAKNNATVRKMLLSFEKYSDAYLEDLLFQTLTLEEQLEILRQKLRMKKQVGAGRERR